MGVDGVSSTNTGSITPPLKPAENTKSSSVSGDIWTEAKVAPKFEPKSTSTESKPSGTSEISVPYRPADDTSSVVEARRSAHASQVDDIAKLKAMAMAQYNEGRYSTFTGFHEVNNSQVEPKEVEKPPVEIQEVSPEESDNNSDEVPVQSSAPVEIVEVKPKRVNIEQAMADDLDEADVEKYSKFPETDDPTVRLANEQIELGMNRDNLTDKQKAAVRKIYSDVLNMQSGDTIVSRGNSYVNNDGDITVNGIKTASINDDDNDVRAYADKAAIDLENKFGRDIRQEKIDSLATLHTRLRNQPDLSKEDSLQLKKWEQQAVNVAKSDPMGQYEFAPFKLNLKGFTE